MKRLLLAAVVLAASASASNASAMEVATFLTKAEAVQARGLAGMVSRDARDVINEITQATRALREERLAAEASGQTPAYCPRGGPSLTQEEILEAMRAVPAAARGGAEVRDALRTAYAQKYPC